MFRPEKYKDTVFCVLPSPKNNNNKESENGPKFLLAWQHSIKPERRKQPRACPKSERSHLPIQTHTHTHTFFLDLSLSLSLWCFFFLSFLPPPPPPPPAESTDPRRSASPVGGMEAIEGRPGGAAGADRPGGGIHTGRGGVSGGGLERHATAGLPKQRSRLQYAINQHTLPAALPSYHIYEQKMASTADSSDKGTTIISKCLPSFGAIDMDRSI